MGAVAIAGTSYNDLGQSGMPAAQGIYYALEPFGNPPREHEPIYDEMQVGYEGIDGVGIKRRGFRGRMIDVDLCVIAATKALCESQKNTLMAAISTLAGFAVQVPGGTSRSNCRKSKALVTGWHTWNSMIVMTMACTFFQARE